MPRNSENSVDGMTACMFELMVATLTLLSQAETMPEHLKLIARVPLNLIHELMHKELTALTKKNPVAKSEKSKPGRPVGAKNKNVRSVQRVQKGRGKKNESAKGLVH